MKTVIRAKVQVHEHRTTLWNQDETTVILRPVHAGAEIPSGNFEMLMKNSLIEHFPKGKYLNVDFSEIDPSDPESAW